MWNTHVGTEEGLRLLRWQVAAELGQYLTPARSQQGRGPLLRPFFFGRNPLLVRLSCFDTYRLRNGLVFRHGFLQLREQTEHQPS